MEKITDNKLRGWVNNPPEKDVEHRIGDGFTVRCRSSGAVSFAFVYTRDKKRRRITVGSYPAVRLAEARARHQELLAAVRLGRDPWEEAQVEAAQTREESERHREQRFKAEAEQERLAALGTVEQLFDLYLKDLEADGKRAAQEVRRIYERDIKAAIGTKKASAVSADECADIVTSIAERGALTLANRTRSYLITAFNFGAKVKSLHRWRRKAPDFALAGNPAASTEKALKRERRGQRHLSREELKTVWDALGETFEIDGGHGSKRTARLDVYTEVSLKMLFATGQRVEEVLHADWSEFDTRNMLWTIPAERRKNRHHNESMEPHLVPLTEFHLELLAALRPLSGTARNLFPGKATTLRDHRSLSRAVTRLCARKDIDQFSPRDIRRTWKTLAGSIGIDLEIRNRIQGHAMDDVGSIHYDRYDYLEEKRAAMARWTNWLSSLLEGEDNVVNLKRSA